MTCSAAKRNKVCNRIEDSLLALVETACSAEAEIFRGSPDARILMKLVAAASVGIAQLAPTYDVLEYAKTHGPGPYEEGELSGNLPHDSVTLNRAVDRLASQGILNPREAAA